MKLLPIVLVILTLGPLSGQQLGHAQTSAQNPVQMERPTWKVGDRWVQTLKNSRKGSGREISTVVKVGDFEGTPAYFIAFDTEWTDEHGSKRRERYTKIRDMEAFSPIGYLDDRGRVVLRRKTGWLKWPLVVGNSWNLDGSYEFLDSTGWVKRKEAGTVLVNSSEEVVTPAGTFATFHVQTVLRLFDDRGQATGHSEEDDWVSPQLRIWAKYSYRSSDGSEEGEVVEHQPGP